MTLLVGRFLDDFLETVDRWADWAGDAIEARPEDPRRAEADPVALADTVQRGVERAARWRGRAAAGR